MKTLAWMTLAAGCGYLLGARKDFRQDIMAADRAFDARTAEQRIDGWVWWFAPDGKMVRRNGEVVEGHEAIRKYMGPGLAEKGASLRWAPEFAEASKSGDLGYTCGRSKYRGLDESGAVVESDGRYVTIWRRGPDGSWKVALDIGVSNPPKKVP
ncbi:MAG: DUF4440 domain-containing protein [Bryobacteraceae bacterium]